MYDVIVSNDFYNLVCMCSSVSCTSCHVRKNLQLVRINPPASKRSRKKTGNKGGMVQYGWLNEFDADSKPITVYLESELYFKQCRKWKACVDFT